jgi:hypothetical protein
MNDFGHRFLTAPDLFPARLAGETWGEGAMDVDLPGGPFRFTGLNGEQSEGLTLRYGSAAVSAAAFTIAVYRAPSEDFLPIDTRGWEYSLDFLRLGDTLAITGMHFMARIDFARSRAAIWTPVRDAEPFWGVAENVLRPLVAIRLLATGGLLIHSAAVAIGGNGLLFAGPSGSGKSTVAGLAVSAGHPVLSDDLNAIVRHGDGFRIVPLPFTGDLDESQLSREAAPLRAIVRLQKGASEELASMTRAEAVSLVVRSAAYVNVDEPLADALLDRAAEVVAASRRAVLTFRRDGDIWPILESL